MESLLQELRDFHHKLAVASGDITSQMKKSAIPNAAMADLGYYLREISNLADECRKEAKARSEEIGKTIAISLIEKSMSSGNDNDFVNGKVARAQCSMKMEAAIPKEGTPEFLQLLDYLGINTALVLKGYVKLSWSKVMELVNNLAESGKPLPTGISKRWPKFGCVFTKRT